MASKRLRQWLPNPARIRARLGSGFLGRFLEHPNLWHINRRSIAAGVAVGMFCTFVLLPGQTALAALFALAFNANLPTAVLIVWVINPITMPPLLYLAYELGTAVLRLPEVAFEFEPSLAWLTSTAELIWQPLLLGCAVLAVTTATGGYFATRGLWRLYVVYRWDRKRAAAARR